MRLNARGHAIGRGHIDGRPLTPPWVGAEGSEFCPLTDDSVIAQWYGGGQPAIIASQITATEWLAQTFHGANWIRAGQGRWFAFLAGASVSNKGGPYTDLAPCDVDPVTGTAVLTRYSTGRDLVLLTLEGREVTFETGPIGTDAVAFRNARLRGGWLLYQADGRWALESPDGPVTIVQRRATVDYAVPVPLVDGRCLLLERAEGKLSLRACDSTVGWLVAIDARPDGLVAPDAISFSADSVRVTWSNDQSESAAAFAMSDVLITTPPVDLDAQPLPPVSLVPFLNRPFWFGPFRFGSSDGVGNIEIAFPRQMEQALATSRKLIVPADQAGLVPPGRLHSIWCDEIKPSADPMTWEPLDSVIRRSRPVADRLGVGLSVYVDGPDYDPALKPQLRPWDTLMLQCYVKPGEPNASFLERVEGQLLALSAWPQEVILIVGTHDGVPPRGERAIVQALIADLMLAEGYPDVVSGAIYFAEDRADALMKFPEVRRYLARAFAGVAGEPKIPSPYVPEDPDEPEESDMADRVFIQDPSGKPNVLMARPLKEITHGEALELRLDDGKMLSVLPDGRFTYDATVFQAYQMFRVAKNNPSQYIVERDGHVYHFGRLVAE